MPLEHATSPLPDGRDVVIYPRGASFGFVLPAQHTVSVNEADQTVYLSPLNGLTACAEVGLRPTDSRRS